jgi:hypothetical protein
MPFLSGWPESSNINVLKLTSLNYAARKVYQCFASMSCPVCNHFEDFQEKLSSEGTFERGTYLKYRKSGQNGCDVCLVMWRSLFGFVQKLGGTSTTNDETPQSHSAVPERPST